MGITLSATDIARLRATQEALLAPDGGHGRAWIVAAAGAVRALVGAGHASVLTGGAAPEILHTTLPEDAQAAYVGHFASRDVATRRALRRNLRVAHLYDVWRPDAYLRSELHHDFAARWGLHDALLLRADGGSGRSVWVALQHTTPLEPAGIERSRDLLRLVQPAFHAGVQAFIQRDVPGAGLARMIDALPGACMACSAAGAVVHENRELHRLLGADPEGSVVTRAMQRLAAGLARAPTRLRSAATAPLPAARTVRTVAARYTLSCTVAHDVLGSDPLVLVHLTRTATSPQATVPAPSTEALRRRFGLTPRELDVALLLAERLTNREVAATLGISRHTAERHTERVLLKLGVSSRTQVRARLLDPAGTA